MDRFWSSFEYFMQNTNKNWNDMVLIQAIVELSVTDNYKNKTLDEIWVILNNKTAEVR